MDYSSEQVLKEIKLTFNSKLYITKTRLITEVEKRGKKTTVHTDLDQIGQIAHQENKHNIYLLILIPFALFSLYSLLAYFDCRGPDLGAFVLSTFIVLFLLAFYQRYQKRGILILAVPVILFALYSLYGFLDARTYRCMTPLGISPLNILLICILLLPILIYIYTNHYSEYTKSLKVIIAIVAICGLYGLVSYFGCDSERDYGRYCSRIMESFFFSTIITLIVYALFRYHRDEGLYISESIGDSMKKGLISSLLGTSRRSIYVKVSPIEASMKPEEIIDFIWATKRGEENVVNLIVNKESQVIVDDSIEVATTNQSQPTGVDNTQVAINYSNEQATPTNEPPVSTNEYGLNVPSPIQEQYE